MPFERGGNWIRERTKGTSYEPVELRLALALDAGGRARIPCAASRSSWLVAVMCSHVSDTYLTHSLPSFSQLKHTSAPGQQHGRKADSGSARSAYLSPLTCDCLSMCRLTRDGRFVRLRVHRIYCSTSSCRVESSESIPATWTPRSRLEPDPAGGSHCIYIGRAAPS
jgi:hypothetical protein